MYFVTVDFHILTSLPAGLVIIQIIEEKCGDNRI